jgi:diguanylate cyclase (GGDEF)-like protein/PAS domain S-box-containing protein
MSHDVLDLTEETLDALIKSEERYRTIVSQLTDAVFVFDPQSDQILYANPRACRVLGYSHDELLKTRMSSLHPHEMPKLRALIEAPPGQLTLFDQLTSITKEGEAVPGEIAASVARVDGRPCLIASIRDISERTEESNRRLDDAMHDPLTNLPNRALFEDRFEVALARKERNGSTLAVLLFDIDEFKLVNDNHGHQVGDGVLKATADILQSVLRPSDAAARFGGDEFTVLCEDIGNEYGAVQVARRITAAVSTTHVVEEREIPISVSMGIAVTAGGRESPPSLIRNADAAMYRAKANGRGRFEVFDERMRLRALERLGDEVALERAVERDELKLVYQPQLDLRTGDVVGAEALLRWDHPKRGTIAPGDFIGLAEETGLIVPIGVWVLREACLTAQVWRATRSSEKPFTMAVNVSARQLGQSSLVDDVAEILEETGTDPSTLCLEITESVIGADSPSSIRQLWGLKELGITLAMDDFGKGYSSLSYLKSLPVDILKIDQSFVLGIPQANDKALLQAAVDMAHALGLQVVAEGVENVEQLQKVQSSGSDLAQGFYFARPQASLATV